LFIEFKAKAIPQVKAAEEAIPTPLGKLPPNTQSNPLIFFPYLSF